ncbi:lipid A export permease/ATP-binding protein MsbA [Denitromonas ohlonensis]|uniref:Lipid A export permease/ATP-binding protein MsbA n=2 Tax=Denitromonas TaxID=139331 RepID=A0A558E0B5_9RHOO|nr:lipid A export permease/ATP-binding protein MsbA [Denitromonas ohlonensis]TVO67981.1 lipid A export permease/ATP-binding protein MsbA [Denitromonas ohlonensis]TVO78114.1 lipid A export permease/ATP-binding protein MsbA [Denitromonas ohlonensis]TVT47185.1 MAG: lipid A export permease/ATP-binding protein MsbA [Denitromonas halophila]TVT66804.1 MAG: lipid A export permease/ATP-binding protein MsbA [Denitromonas halophila]
MKEGLALYRRLLGSILPYRKVVALSVIAMIAAASLEPVLPALLKPLIDESLIGKSESAQWKVPLLLMLAFLGKGIAEYLSSVSSQWVANKAITDLRQQVFRHQMHLPVSAHQAEAQGRMLSRILYDIPQVGSALSNAWIIVVRDTLVVIGLTGYLVWTAWELTLLLLIVAPVMAIIIRQASRKLRGGNRAMQATTGHMTGAVEESLNGVREIKIFGAHDHENSRFAEISERLRKETMRTVRVSAANVPIVQIVAATAVSLVIWAASALSAEDRLTPGTFVSFVAAMAMLFEPIRRLTNVNNVIQKGLAGAQSIFELLDSPAEPDTAVGTVERGRGALRFESVGFRYAGQSQAAVSDFTLDIPPGKTVALVGASGSGKTTIIQLIARFFDPASGRILLDGTPLSELPLAALRAQIGWVGQQVVLFDDTIAANIAYGRPDITAEDIETAARHAHAMEFIAKLPDGLATRVGANGSQLSGGQRQRVAIARAFLKNAPILLLDEATSALDNESERAVKDALAELRQNRTVLVVAHRLSTIRDADLIVVMEHGRIVEQGTHAELANSGGAYARLLASGEGVVVDEDAPAS